MSKVKITELNKKIKDPKAPKRYRTAYILFSIEKRNQVKNENPKLSSKEILSELAAQWKLADPQIKQHFQKLSDDEKVQYEQKSNAYKNEKMNEKENSQKEKSTIEENNQLI